MSKLKNKCNFLDAWLENRSCKPWLGKSKSSYNVFCKFCVKDIAMSIMGCRTLDSTQETKNTRLNNKKCRA